MKCEVRGCRTDPSNCWARHASTDLECIRCAHTMESIEEGGKLVIDRLVEKEVCVQANKLWRNKGKWYLCWGEGLEEGGFPHYLTFPVAFGYSDVLAAWLQVDGHCITIGLVGHLGGGEGRGGEGKRGSWNKHRNKIMCPPHGRLPPSVPPRLGGSKPTCYTQGGWLTWKV